MKLELCYLKITICRQMLSFQHLKAQRLIIFYMMAPWKSTCSWLFNYAFKCILLHLKLDLRLFISFVILPKMFSSKGKSRKRKVTLRHKVKIAIYQFWICFMTIYSFFFFSIIVLWIYFGNNELVVIFQFYQFFIVWLFSS